MATIIILYMQCVQRSIWFGNCSK